jgi:PAS domain-containing protein
LQLFKYKSEENFRAIFDENPMPTLMSEIPSGKMNFVNKRLAESMGLKVEDLIGKSPNELSLLKDPANQEKLTRLDTIQRTAKLDSLGILAGGIVHDFNNLLTGIYGYMDLARSVCLFRKPRSSRSADRIFLAVSHWQMISGRAISIKTRLLR